MNPDGKGRVRLDYVIPSRGLIGFRSEFMTMTSGTGLLYSTFSHYDDIRPGEVGQRQNGVLISNGQGKAVAFALFGLQDRGKLFPGSRRGSLRRPDYWYSQSLQRPDGKLPDR